MVRTTPGYLERISAAVTRWSGTSLAFLVASSAIAVWILAGPFYGYSDSWQLLMNTITSIVTFLMVFLIQRAQNKESSAIQLKLNELIAAMDGASNRMINVEDRSEQEVQRLQRIYRRIVRQARRDPEPTKPCSIAVTTAPPPPSQIVADPERPGPVMPDPLRRSIRWHLRQIARHEVEISAIRAAVRACPTPPADAPSLAASGEPTAQP